MFKKRMAAIIEIKRKNLQKFIPAVSKANSTVLIVQMCFYASFSIYIILFS